MQPSAFRSPSPAPSGWLCSRAPPRQPGARRRWASTSREMRLVLSALVLCLSLACGTTPQGSPPAANQLTTTVQQLHEGQVVDGVPCQHDDLPAQHFHVHLEVLLAGRLSRYPPASGSEGRGGRTRTGSSRRGAASPGSILTTRPVWCTCSRKWASHIRWARGSRSGASRLAGTLPSVIGAPGWARQRA